MNTNPKIVFIIVIVEGTLLVICTFALCGTLFYRAYTTDPQILLALVSVENLLLGSFTTILASPRAMPAGPLAVNVENRVSEPVPVEVAHSGVDKGTAKP